MFEPLEGVPLRQEAVVRSPEQGLGPECWLYKDASFDVVVQGCIASMRGCCDTKADPQNVQHV